MKPRLRVAARLGVLAGLVWASAAPALADPKGERWTSGSLPLGDMPAGVRDRVRQVVDRPTVTASGPAEEFVCQPATYQWLLDHPDRAVLAWRRLGATCADITDRGGGRFGWADGSGNEVHWDTVYRGPGLRVWYAEGSVCPGALLAPVAVQAVVIMRQVERKDKAGRPVVRHQADVLVHADSKTAALAAKVINRSNPELAEQHLGQLGKFFSGLAGYLYQNPEQAPTLLAEPEKKGAKGRKE